MTDRVPVAARIPVSEIQAVEEAILAEHGKVRGYKGQFVQSAMEAFIDENETRATLDALNEAQDMLADSFDGFSRRRSSLSGTHSPSEWSGEEKKQYGARIDPDLKERFKVCVRENTNLSYGDAVTRAMREYRQLNPEHESRKLAEHLRDELDELRESGSFSDAATDESDDTTSSASEKNPYSEEDKLAAIRDDVLDRWPEPAESFEEIEGAKIPLAWFTESIDQWCTKSGRDQATEKTRNKYLDLLSEEFGLERDGANFVVGGLDGLPFERKSFDDLTPEERAEAVRVKLLRKADRGRGAQVTAAKIQTEFFDGEPSDSVSHKLRDKAAEATGFGIRKPDSRKKYVYVDPENVTDDTIREAAGLSTLDEREKYRKEAAQELDQQDAGHPARANS